jgi:FKBP-type peptidyl-prolyl cis-trans isomerase
MILATALCLMAAPALAADPSLSPAANAAYLAANAKKPGVIVNTGGLQYRIVKNGFGQRPGPADTVTVNYKGSLINGKVFDATEPGMPAQLEVDKVIPGWTEALSQMRVGDHWVLTIPPQLAYGDRGAGNGLIPPGQVLIFDMELLGTTPPPPKQPGQDDQPSH